MAQNSNPIRKVAIFVEGKTELKFVEKLLKEILSENQYAIQTREMRGTKDFIKINVLNQGVLSDSIKCFVLITDCGSDSTVKSYILEQRQSLINNGYSTIIGLIDLYPKNKTDLFHYRYGLNFKVPQLPIPISFVISIMEIEAWFISEYSHFEKIDSRLTPEFIRNELSIDITSLVTEDILHPAQLLNDIYQLVSKGYAKRAKQIQKTVDNLDYAEIYFSMPSKIESLNEFVELINTNIIS